MDLVEIGAALRAGRTSKGLSIEEVETKIKIAQSVIVALEEGNSSKFPHPVYARGFVRSYSMLLGLDEGELCAHFSREYPVPTDHDHVEEHVPQIKVKVKEFSTERLPVAKIAIGAGIVLLTAATGWFVFDAFQSKKISLPSFSSLNSTTSAPSAISSATPDVAAKNETTAVPAPVIQTPVAEQKEPEKTSEVAVLGTRTLVVTAKSASWLQAHADDKVIDYFLRKNESASIPFNKALSIKFGNAGGVKLELDGQPYAFDGKQGEIKTLVIK